MSQSKSFFENFGIMLPTRQDPKASFPHRSMPRPCLFIETNTCHLDFFFIRSVVKFKILVASHNPPYNTRAWKLREFHLCKLGRLLMVTPISWILVSMMVIPVFVIPILTMVISISVILVTTVGWSFLPLFIDASYLPCISNWIWLGMTWSLRISSISKLGESLFDLSNSFIHFLLFVFMFWPYTIGREEKRRVAKEWPALMPLLC